MEYIHHYDSPLGGITMASDGKALTGLWFDGQKYFAKGLDKDIRKKNLPVFEQTDQWLDSYFRGKAPGFTPPLNMKTTPFRKSVWEILLTVGQAVGHNAISLIVPCHRVVGANGSLTGYAGGIDKKAKLLALEQGDMSSLFVPGALNASG